MPGAIITAAPDATETPSSGASLRHGRLEFLDALRGIAAVSVAAQHAAEILWPSYLRWSVEVFRPGEFGVFLFFLVSGFIIPASIEKNGSVKLFWVGRFYRLFPLYWFALLIVLVLERIDPNASDVVPPHRSPGEILQNLSMLQEFVGAPNVIGASWTLAYEMVFYLLASALFLAGLLRRTVPLTIVLVCLGAGTATMVPSRAVTDPTRQGWAATLAATVLVIYLLLRSAPCDRKTQLSIVLFGGLAVPLVMNRAHSMWFAMTLFATFFLGTVLFRWHRGLVSTRTAGLVAAGAVLGNLVGTLVNVESRVDPAVANGYHTWRPEFLTYAVAVGLFCLFLGFRSRSFPRALTFLGTISYSIYLVHAVVIHYVPELSEEWQSFILWMALTIGVATVTYYAIEKPFHEKGQRIVRSRAKVRAAAGEAGPRPRSP